MWAVSPVVRDGVMTISEQPSPAMTNEIWKMINGK
jgi:hypothetical protein